jgi:hypothetical protein
MSKEKLLKLLKENLTIKIKTDEYYPGYFDEETGQFIYNKYIVIFFDNEEITKVELEK